MRCRFFFFFWENAIKFVRHNKQRIKSVAFAAPHTLKQISNGLTENEMF